MLPTEQLPRGGYWLQFEDIYRAQEIKEIASWLRFGYSGAVVGGSGSGKSNLCGFIYTKPQVLLQHMQGKINGFLFCYLDVNSLPGITTDFFYREMLQVLHQASLLAEPQLTEQVNELIAQPGVHTDILTMSHTLDQIHKLVIRRSGRTIIWLIDRFDEACRQLGIGALNNLRWLRDQSRFADGDRFRAKLSYILFTRQPLDRLRDRDEITDFIEIIEDHITWVGPMSAADTRWNIDQIAQRIDAAVEPFTAAMIAKLSGGLTSFTKTITEAFLEGKLLSNQTEAEWIEKILALPACSRICQEILNELNPIEQAILTAVVNGTGVADAKLPAVQYLYNLGYLTKLEDPKADKTTKQPGRFAIVSPILHAYIGRNRQNGRGIFSVDPQSGTISLDGMSVTESFTVLESRMLRYVIPRAGQLCRSQVLEDHIWPHDLPINDNKDSNRKQSLATLVKQLRRKTADLAGNQHEYIITVRGQGFQFEHPKHNL